MKRLNTIFIPAITLLMAAGLIQLRDWQLEKGFAAEIPLGGVTTWLVLGLVAVAAVLWLLLSRCIASGKDYTQGRGMAIGLTALVAGLGIAVSSAWALYSQRGDLLAIIADVLGLLGGFCLCLSGLASLMGRRLPAPVQILPYVFVMLRLVSDFRGWSIDPIVLDYGFRHFGLIFAMCALYCSASLAFGKGRRRLTAFWAMGGVCLCAMGSAGLALMDALLYMALTFACLSVLMRVTGESPAEN